MKVVAYAYAKLNLTLDVSKKRDDGYHEIETVFQSISLYDTLEVARTDGGISVYTDSDILKEDNICYKAADKFFKTTGISGGAKITLNKNIPIAAGLGGGSTDGAATLKALNYLWGNPLNTDQLLSLCKTLGADVPFCLLGGTAYSLALGDEPQKINDLPDCDIIIIKDATKPSTAELYRKIDAYEFTKRPDNKAVLKAIEEGNLTAACENFYNVFSYAWGDTLDYIENDLLNEGALTARLSGSGPSVYGIYKKGEGQKAYDNLCKKYANVYLCAPKKSPGAKIVV